MFNLRTAVALCFVLTVATAARAEPLIEFEFGGVFTQTTGSVHQVGDPYTATLLFDAAAPDINPLPTRGRYQYISLTAPDADTTPVVLTPPAGTIEVFADPTNAGWQVNYFGASQFQFTVSVSFPDGYFTSDALPLTLDLSQQTQSRYTAFIGATGLDLIGTVDTLTVRVIPEPWLTMWSSGGLFLLLRRGRR